MAIKRYEPTIGPANWDIKSLSKEERQKILKRLVPGITHSEEEYQTVIGYLHIKYADLMDNNPDGMNLQWNYSPKKNKAKTIDKKTGQEFDMYAFCYFDPERDMEPVCFGGSHLLYANPLKDENNVILPNQNIDEQGRIIIGMGYVLFVDPDYRRMGIADHQWVSEASLYRDSGIRFQREIQNEHSIKVTQAMFDDPNKCIITSPGRLKNDGTRCQIRCLLDYSDKSLIRAWENMPNNLKDFRKPFDFRFLEREGLTKEELIKPWNK